MVPDQEMSLDALDYLGGLFEARFYQPHSTTDDPRDEIREAASLYGLDLAMMMSIAKVESDFDPRVRPSTTVRAARCAGDRPHLAAVLQEGRKYAHIHARSGVIWGPRLKSDLQENLKSKGRTS
jgi:hypothetical protein